MLASLRSPLKGQSVSLYKKKNLSSKDSQVIPVHIRVCKPDMYVTHFLFLKVTYALELKLCPLFLLVSIELSVFREFQVE